MREPKSPGSAISEADDSLAAGVSRVQGNLLGVQCL